MGQLIIVVGSQRTGSTLMTLVLGAHPDLRRRQDSDLTNLVYGDYEERDVVHGVIWTARYQILPQAKYIFMIRDIRAVVSSMLSFNWAELFAVEEIARALLGVSDWEKQYRLIPVLGKYYREKNLIKLATMCAYLKTYMLHEYQTHNLSVYPVRYEDLVRNPKEILSGVLSFLGVAWDDNVLLHHRNVSEPVFAGNDPARPIDVNSIDKWHSLLSDDAKRDIAETTRELDDIFDGWAQGMGLC